MTDKNLQNIKEVITTAGNALLAYSKTGAACLPLDGNLYVAVGSLAGIASAAGKVMDEAAPAAQAPSQVPAETDGWLIDDGLIYRLNDQGFTCDEINVTMVNGSRDTDARHDAAVELLAELRASSHEVRLSAVREARNEALEVLRMVAKELDGCSFSQSLVRTEDGRQVWRYITGEDVVKRVRELVATSPAASKEGDTSHG